MNKKTKSFAVGLVAVLCFLLVFAIGFGVTGAWYQAKRQAKGTVKMDQGIYLTFTNLQTLTNGTTGDLTSKMEGQLLYKDGETAKPLTDLSVVPGQTVTLKNPTITGGTTPKNSVPFYVRAKVTYTVKLYEVGSTSAIADTIYTLEEAGLTEDSLFKTATGGSKLAFDAAWVEGKNNWYYLGSGVTVGTLTEVTAGMTPNKLFVTSADDNTELTFCDWTADSSVERGGPAATVDSVAREVAQVIITLDIEVIQVANVEGGDLTAAGWEAKA